jgi:hypothetical protein
MGSDPWPKAITSTVGHLTLSFLVAKPKRPPSRAGGRRFARLRPTKALGVAMAAINAAPPAPESFPRADARPSPAESSLSRGLFLRYPQLAVVADGTANG